MAKLSMVIVVVFLFVSVAAGAIAPYPKDQLFFTTSGSPSWDHPFGLDLEGRDVLTEVIWGSRTALIVIIVATAVIGLLGVTVGAMAGYYGGIMDEVLMRMTDTVLVFPFVLIIILAAKTITLALPRPPPGLVLMIIATMIGFFNWPQIAKLTRGEFLKLRTSDFVKAARCLGTSERRILFRHVLPNSLPPIVVALTATASYAIMLEASISFLGLGDPTAVSWGWLLSMAQFRMPSGWWQALFPGLALFITILGFNQLGDALNDALNPRLKE